MKKVLLAIAAVLTSFNVMAETKQYEDQLTVAVRTEAGVSVSSQRAVVEVETLANGNINFTLKNFILDDGAGNMMPVGNIVINDLTLAQGQNYDTFDFKGDINILDGDDESVPMWIGPMLGAVPLNMSGKITDAKLYVGIDITMVVNDESQQIHVDFGTEFASQQEFNDKLKVVVNEAPSVQDATVVVDYLLPQNGRSVSQINFNLKNFVLDDGAGNVIPVGNIVVKNLELQQDSQTSYQTIAFNGNLLIMPGDDANEQWIGPFLGDIPLDLSGKLEGNKLYVTIEIEMGGVGHVHVEFGSDIENAIAGVEADVAQQTEIYDLAGRRVSRATKGIYVINGKKVIK